MAGHLPVGRWEPGGRREGSRRWQGLQPQQQEEEEQEQGGAPAPAAGAPAAPPEGPPLAGTQVPSPHAGFPPSLFKMLLE